MRQTTTILILVAAVFLMAACEAGDRKISTNTSNGSATTTGATSNTASTGVNSSNGTSEAAGVGPKNQGIGGTGDSSSNTNVINHNTKTVPPGVSEGSSNSNRP